MRIAVLATAISSAVIGLALADPAAAAMKTRTNIAPQALSSALRVLAAERQLQILYTTDTVANRHTSGAVGEFTVDEALTQLLGGTGLVFRYVDDSTITIMAVDESPAERGGPVRQERVELEEVIVTIPEVLVRGSKSLNMDIRRTEDDPQPYVVFESDTLRRSGAQNLEEFFKQRLPMNAIGETQNQFSSTRPNGSQINLRGLGANQTLILVDGQRLADDLFVEGPNQGDINSIPLGAIERVEILPTTASGIYGGRATGGVINIVLRRDYQGVEADAAFENTFDSWTPTYRANLTGGFSFAGGKTSMLMSVHYADVDDLLVRERGLVQRYQATRAVNNPSLYAPPNVPDGSMTNIASADGSPLFGPGTASFTSVPQGYAGGGGIEPLRANAGTYNTALSQATSKLTLWNSATVKSALVTLRHELSPTVQVVAEAATAVNDGQSPFSSEPGVVFVAAGAPSNPFGQDVQVRLNDGIDSLLSLDNRTRRFRVGSIVRVGGERRGDEVLGSWNLITGGNPDLEPEDSKSGSAGLILTPRFAPGLRFSVDYTRIEKTNNIFDPGDLPFIDLAAFEAAFPNRVIRAPAAPGDPFGVGPITTIDVSAINISRAEVEAFDFSVDYRWETGSRGTFDAFLLATRQTHFQTQVLPTDPIVENVGIGNGNPLAFRANAGLTWRWRSWAFGWTGRYFDSYTVALNPSLVASQGGTKVASQQYHDVFASYRFGDSGAGPAHGTEITLGIKNVFNEEPPFDAANALRLYSPFGDPRLASYGLSVRTTF